MKLSSTLFSLVLLSLVPLGLAAQERATQAPPPEVIGVFEDDYGSLHRVSAEEWVQRSGFRYRIVEWHPEDRYLIAQNDPSNPSEGGLWTRIDWVKLSGMDPWGWGFCMIEWQAASRSEAERASGARPEDPRSGCNGNPFTRMRRASVP